MASSREGGRRGNFHDRLQSPPRIVWSLFFTHQSLSCLSYLGLGLSIFPT